MLISTIDYNEYVGRIGIGKITRGSIKVNQDALLVNHHDPDKQKVRKDPNLYEFDGLNKIDVPKASMGSIVAISGIENLISGIRSARDHPDAIPFQKIAEPTIDEFHGQ